MFDFWPLPLLFVCKISKNVILPSTFRLRADEDQFHLEVDLTTPKVVVKGAYSAEGTYNFLQVNASGEFNTTLGE